MSSTVTCMWPCANSCQCVDTSVYVNMHVTTWHACRVATAQGKQGIWFLLFPDRENTGNFALTQGKILRHRENIFLWHREKFWDTGKIFFCDREKFRHRENIWLWLLKWKVCLLFKFQKNFSLASLGINLHLKVLSTFTSTCFIYYFTCVFTL